MTHNRHALEASESRLWGQTRMGRCRRYTIAITISITRYDAEDTASISIAIAISITRYKREISYFMGVQHMEAPRATTSNFTRLDIDSGA